MQRLFLETCDKGIQTLLGNVYHVGIWHATNEIIRAVVKGNLY